jgi:hypothetical protein
MKIGITEVLLGEYIVRIESDGGAKFFDGALPISLQGIGISGYYAAWPCLGTSELRRTEQESVLKQAGFADT